MPVKIFLKLTACVTFLIGLTLLFLPALMSNLFLTNPGHGQDIFIRFLGSSLIGYTYLNWLSARLDHLMNLRATIIGNLSTLTIACFLSLFGLLSGELTRWGILMIVVHLTFALGFGYYAYQIRSQS